MTLKDSGGSVSENLLRLFHGSAAWTPNARIYRFYAGVFRIWCFVAFLVNEAGYEQIKNEQLRE